MRLVGLVLARLPQRLHDRLMRDVIDAGAEDEGDRHRAAGQQAEEILRGQVRGERPAIRRAVRARNAGPRGMRGLSMCTLPAIPWSARCMMRGPAGRPATDACVARQPHP
jgi:hypothetical protein